MDVRVDVVMVILVLTNLLLLGSSRLGACIRIIALQGIVLGFLPLLAHQQLHAGTIFLAVGAMGLKGIAFPILLRRALRAAEVRREVEPYIGYGLSLACGIGALVVSFWISAQLPIPGRSAADLVVPVALSTCMVGLLVIVSRKKALSQVLGYLTLENGIYAFGVGLALQEPFLVELGVLLDVFVAVFVMGIAIFHISREFDHVDADRLTTLRDWTTRMWSRSELARSRGDTGRKEAP